MKKALLLIDIQNDYFAGGRNRLVNSEQAAEIAKLALDFFRRKNLPVFHIQHISLHEGADFFLPDSEGCKIYESVFPEQNEAVIVKHTPDSFLMTDLHQQLSHAGIGQLFVCGMMTHMCLDTSVRSAKMLGYEVCLLHEACATKDLVWNGEIIPSATVHKTFMASLAGIFAEVISVNELENRLL